MSNFNAENFFNDADNLARFNEYREEKAAEYADCPNPVHEVNLAALSWMLYEDSTAMYKEFYEERGEKFEGDMSDWAYDTAWQELNSDCPANYQTCLDELYQYMPEDFKRSMEEKEFRGY